MDARSWPAGSDRHRPDPRANRGRGIPEHRFADLRHAVDARQLAHHPVKQPRRRAHQRALVRAIELELNQAREGEQRIRRARPVAANGEGHAQRLLAAAQQSPVFPADPPRHHEIRRQRAIQR